MNNNSQTKPSKQQQNEAKQRVRKATFAEIPNSTDNDKMKSSRTSNPYTTNQSNNTNNNNNHKQKKQKQHNNTTTNNNNTKNNKDKSKVTSYFASAPARTDERVKNSRASLLASRKGLPTRKGSSQDVSFNHKNRFDVNVTLYETNLEARLIELKKNIDELMSIIIQEDKNAKLLPWKASKQDRHPAISSSDDTTGSFADIYLSRSWLGHIDAKHRLYLKLHIGHDKSYNNNILPALEDWNSHSDRQFKYCMIQAEETTFIGWFLYSTLSIDAGALSDAIYDNLNVEVGLRWMDIRMNTQGKRPDSKTKPVKAIHVETEKSKGRSIMETLMKNYGRSFDKTRNFPNGIRLRFCKNIDNAAYKQEKTKLINLRSRQKQLVAETYKATNAGILDLEVVLKENIEVNEETNVTTTTITTLRDAIMDIQSKYVKQTPLFRSVDLAYDSEEFIFAYHQSMSDEAKAMVDYLYPYLLHLYDKKALKKAFDSTHIKEMKSFQYNIISDEVEDTIAENSYAMMKNDKLTGAQDFMEFDLSAMSLDKEESERPQASILGKMYSGHDSISTQNHAGKTRTPQATQDDEILEITHDELRELQHAMLLHTQSKGKTSERKNTIHIANLDTNSILKQIRARKAQEILKPQSDNDMEDEISNLEVEEQDNSEEELEDEENYFDPEGNAVYEEETEDNDMDYDEESTSEEQDNDSAGNEQESTENNNDIDSEGKPATNCNQIGQSSVIGNEPPTPPREGGRG